MRSYEELNKIKFYEDRLEYLKGYQNVGEHTFGRMRYLNQKFYTSNEWRNVRYKVILRDNSLDLGVEGHPVFGKIIIHHIDPISVDDIYSGSRKLFDMNNLITMSLQSHNYITFGKNIPCRLTERRKGDTCLW